MWISFRNTYTWPLISSSARINGIEHSGLVFPLNNELFRERFLCLKMANALPRQSGRKELHSGLGFFLSFREGFTSLNETVLVLTH
jgi:hypothetical protein